ASMRPRLFTAENCSLADPHPALPRNPRCERWRRTHGKCRKKRCRRRQRPQILQLVKELAPRERS
ncbi:MAG: hypothetical protein AB1761_06660, partial [Pseudomonadota bacterium]